MIYDDGSHTFTDYDQASSETYMLVAFIYNAAGALIQQVTAFDDGTTSYTYFKPEQRRQALCVKVLRAIVRG